MKESVRISKPQSSQDRRIRTDRWKTFLEFEQTNRMAFYVDRYADLGVAGCVNGAVTTFGIEIAKHPEVIGPSKSACSTGPMPCLDGLCLSGALSKILSKNCDWTEEKIAREHDETEACELVAYLWEARRGARDAVGTGEPSPTPGIQEIRTVTLMADW